MRYYHKQKSQNLCFSAIKISVLRVITTPPVSIERSDWLKQEGWLNARATEQNSPTKFVEYWITVQARIDTDGVVKAKTPSAIG